VHEHQDPGARLLAIYERGKVAQWNAGTDVDWSIPVPFGEPIAEESAHGLASFASSPLASRGRRAWDTFRWELQSWMVSQFLYGERAALVVAGRLVEAIPGQPAKFCAAGQAVDEARHVEVFERYLAEKQPSRYPACPALVELLDDVLGDDRWDVTALGMQIVVEALAMAAFRLAGETFHDPLIRRITTLVARDEARHVSFGVVSLQSLYRELTRSELAEREDLVLEAASLTRRRFLLEDVWERLEVPRHDGTAFAATDELMVRYRQAVFAKVVMSLRDIGLLSDPVRRGLAALDLVRA
jgi:P-aminobenzoate N-oxygenase AurF